MLLNSEGQQNYLEQPFVFGCSTAVFPPEEIQALTQRGRLLEALAAGKFKPTNPEQEHFLRVDREEADPKTIEERAWVRLKGRREFEAEKKPSAPAAKADDYGMVEFDADRCWW